MRDQAIDIDPPFHIHIDDSRHIGAPARAAKGRSAPHPPCHKLKRTRLNLGTGRGNANDDALAPSLVTTLKRSAHNIDIANTFKRIISSAPCQLDQMTDQIVRELSRIDKIGHPELARHTLFRAVCINADNLPRTGQFQALNNIEANPAKTKHHSPAIGFHLGCVDNRTNPCRDPATNITNLVKRGVLANFCERNFRQNREIREG